MIYLDQSLTYDFALKDALDNTIWTRPGIVAGITASDLASASTSKGGALVGFIQSGTGAVATTVQAQQRERFSVTQFGADPTGATDSSSAIQAAVAAAIAASAGGPSAVTIVWPAGTYKYTGAGFVQPRWVTHVAEGVVSIDATGLTAGAIFCDVQNAPYTLPSATIGAFAPVWDGKGGGFTIKGNAGLFSAQGTSACFRMGEVTASGNVLLHCRDTGLRNVQPIQFYEGLRITPVNFYLCEFDNVTFNACYYDVHVVGTANNSGENVRFNGCIFTQAKRPISLQASQDFTFAGCSFDFNNDCPVYFETGVSDCNIVFRDCHLEGTTDRLGAVGSDSTVGNRNRVTFDNCQFLPTTFTSAAGVRWGDGFPSPANRADGLASFIKWTTQYTNTVNVRVKGGAVHLLAYNCYPQSAFDVGGLCQFKDVLFPYTTPLPPGLGLSQNINPTFTGMTNGAAVTTSGYGVAGTGTQVFSNAQTFGGDPVSIAMTITGTQYCEVTAPLLPVNAGDMLLQDMMLYAGGTTGGAAYYYIIYYGHGGSEISRETPYQITLDTIYTDTNQPGYNGTRARWIRWPAANVFRAPTGVSFYAAVYGVTSAVGTTYIARPVVNRM